MECDDESRGRLYNVNRGRSCNVKRGHILCKKRSKTMQLSLTFTYVYQNSMKRLQGTI